MVQVLQFLLLLSKVSTVGDVKNFLNSALCQIFINQNENKQFVFVTVFDRPL